MENSWLQISELFYSLQGESTFSGLPCVFIRLSGCNLRCTYCDARYSYEEVSQDKSIEDLLVYTEYYPQAIVEITGGEPLLQPEVYRLMEALLVRGRTVLLETNGSLPISEVPDGVHIILDVKTPGSGTTAFFHRNNLLEWQRRNTEHAGRVEMKFVLADQNDYIWARQFLIDNRINTLFPVHFSPVRETFSLQQLADAILKDQLAVRMHIQLHTIIWPKISRGI